MTNQNNDVVPEELALKSFFLSDDVLRRIVQIVQEAMLTGIDCVDAMRLIRVCEDVDERGVLELTPEYVDGVKKYHEQLLAEAKLKQGQTAN